MTVLVFPAPPVLNGGNLEAEIAAVIGLAVRVTSRGDVIDVAGPDGLEEAVIAPIVAAHTGLPTPAQQAELDADAEADQAARNLEPILAKCRAVLAGTDTFTAAQVQKLLAGLTLVVHRRLR